MTEPPLLPFEFTVAGRPYSHQTANRRGLAEWRRRVRAAAAARWGDRPPVASPLRIAVVYYHGAAAAGIDVDNLLKPVQDALTGLVYDDDGQLTAAVVRKTPIDTPLPARGASLVLLSGFSLFDPFVYVVVDAASAPSAQPGDP